MTIAIKANFRDDLRRITFKSIEEIRFEKLVAALQERFSLSRAIRLSYKDQDGDTVELRSTPDILATLNLVQRQGAAALRLEVSLADDACEDTSAWEMAEGSSRISEDDVVSICSPTLAEELPSKYIPSEIMSSSVCTGERSLNQNDDSTLSQSTDGLACDAEVLVSISNVPMTAHEVAVHHKENDRQADAEPPSPTMVNIESDIAAVEGGCSINASVEDRLKEIPVIEACSAGIDGPARSYYTPPRPFLVDDFGDTDVNVGASSDPWVDHVIAEGRSLRLILQTRTDNQRRIPSMAAMTGSILQALRLAGSYTDAQINRIGQRLAMMMGVLLPSLLILDEEEQMSDIHRQEIVATEADSDVETDLDAEDCFQGSSCFVARYPSDMHGSTLVTGNLESENEAPESCASTPAMDESLQDAEYAQLLRMEEARHMLSVPETIPTWEIRRWGTKLQTLADMGLIDINLNVHLLRIYDGDLQRVLEHMFMNM